MIKERWLSGLRHTLGKRAYGFPVPRVRIPLSPPHMIAEWVEPPYILLGKVSNRIINEVRGINRIVYDISGKPPETIEWEWFFLYK